MKIQYKAYSLKLNERTKQLLVEKKVASGLSWNLFIYGLLNKEYGQNRKTKKEAAKN